MRSGGAAASCAARELHRLVPADPREARLAAAAQHRVGEPPERAQPRPSPAPERGGVAEHLRVERVERVQLEQPQAHVAQVRAVDRPVAQSRSCPSAQPSQTPRERTRQA